MPENLLIAGHCLTPAPVTSARLPDPRDQATGGRVPPNAAPAFPCPESTPYRSQFWTLFMCEDQSADTPVATMSVSILTLLPPCLP